MENQPSGKKLVLLLRQPTREKLSINPNLRLIVTIENVYVWFMVLG